MKLYTKEDFLKAAEFCEVSMIDARYIIERIDEVTDPIELPSDSLCINCDESESTHNICMDCIIKIGKENIQLPSDEEKSKFTIDYFNWLHTNQYKYNPKVKMYQKMMINETLFFTIEELMIEFNKTFGGNK